MNDKHSVPKNYYSNINADVLGLIPVTAREVLEVGCGTGALGAAFLARQPRARWFGVELDAAAAGSARACLTAVACCDIELEPNPYAIPAASLDALVMGDVLEHLRDPWSTLARLVPLLREGGVAVVCLPNVGYWGVIAGLMAGRFDYANAGLLDRTHLRFFTRATALELIYGAGLQVQEVLPRYIAEPSGAMARFMQGARGMAEAGGVTQADFERNASAYQYVIRSTRGRAAPDTTLDIRQMVFAPDFMDVRTVEPAALLASLPGVTVRTYRQGVALEEAKSGAAHIFIVQRTLPHDEREYLESVANLLAAGYLVVADYDDHPSLYPEPVRAHAAVSVILRACHAIQASTPALVEVLRAWKPELAEVGVLANHLFELPARVQRQARPLTLFFGAVNREKDWSPYIESFNRILEARPQVLVSVVHDRRFYDQVATQNKIFTATLPRREYLRALQAAHVAWLPLRDIPGNRCKSDLKALEAAAGAVALLAEETVYGASLRHGDTAWLYADPAGFAAGLTQLLDDAHLRERLGAAARDWVAAERMAADHVEARRDWYLDLWARRDALTEALYLRLPQLRARVKELIALRSKVQET